MNPCSSEGIHDGALGTRMEWNKMAESNNISPPSTDDWEGFFQSLVDILNDS